jgi:hypothetical protein
MLNFFKEDKPLKRLNIFGFSSLTPRLIAVLMIYKNILSNCFNSLPQPANELNQCTYYKFIHIQLIFIHSLKALTILYNLND